MQKTFYEKELTIAGTQSKNGASNVKKDVGKIQSWLSLFALNNPNVLTSVGVDGDFGSATEQAVINFQKAKGIPQSGVVNQDTFNLLCEPMRNAFEGKIAGTGLRQLVVNTAFNHAKQRPFELVIKGESNSGPWVRAYMDGNEGKKWFWCMGFVQAIIDQAASIQGKDFKTLMPLTFSCDTIGTFGKANGLFMRNATVRNNPAIVKAGDIFLLPQAENDWFHTGIITAIGNDTFETVEGNTNSGGSHNGNAVLKRIRNFRQSKIDVFSIEPLV
jgi:peptidoglycan hydrolase-like protein with peptidoglycan-binding domain